MRRLVLVLVAAALGAGCDGSSDAPRGTLDLAWSFVRTNYDTSTVRYGCDAAGLDSVLVTFDRGGSVRLPCRSGGVEGGVVQRAPAGVRAVTLTGFRGTAALYQTAYEVTIPERGGATLVADVFGIPDELDVFAFFLDENGVDRRWDTCALAGVATLSWSLVDWAGTVVDSAEALCDDRFAPGVSYRGAAALERDEYVIRMQGFGPAGTLEFDSATTRVLLDGITCSGQPFRHFGQSIGNAGWSVLLFDVAALPAPVLCP